MTEFSRLARFSGGISAAAVLLWSGCSRQERCVSDLQPATEQQKILTSKAIDKLQTVFSAGACQSIYDEAGRPFRSQTEVEWLYQCNQLREDLGDWRGFDVGSIETYGASKQLILVEGSGEFAKGRRHLGITWLFDGAIPKLSSLSLKEHGEWRRIPAGSGLDIDTPPALPPGWPSDGIIKRNELLASAPVGSKDQHTVLPCLSRLCGC